MKTPNQSSTIPAPVFENALSLKQPDALRLHDMPNGIAELPWSERLPAMARTLGNASVLAALTDYGITNDDDIRRELTRTKRALRSSSDRDLARYAYLKFWSDKFPPEDWPQVDLPHDVTLTQAFGRNGIKDR